MGKTKKIFILFVLILLAFAISYKVNAVSDFELKKIEFEAVLNENGNMDVKERWEVKINGETNTLFKTFEPDSSKYGGITNVSVAEIKEDEYYNFSESTQWKNHVNTDYFHALYYKGDFEIAWGVNKSSGKHIYEISYTVEDAIKVYSDCAELYWQFIGSNFEVPVDEVVGIVSLPTEVETIDNMRVWGHGQLNGEITRENKQTIKFKMSPFITGTYLEVRVAVLEPEMFTGANITSNKEMLQNIIAEETQWAVEANAQREAIKRNKAILFWGSLVICTGIGAFFIWLAVKNFKKIKETPKIVPTQELEYYRDIPNEESSPSEVGFLYYYGKTSLSMVMPKILSSTMLDLALKKYITFEIKPESPKNEEVIIKLIPDKEADKLKQSEETIYTLLKKIAKEDNQFNMKEFEKYAKKNNTSFLAQLNRIEEQAKKEQEIQKNFDNELKKKHDQWIAKGITILVILTMTVFFLLGLLEISLISLSIAIIPVVIYAMTCFTMGGKVNGLTQKGVDEQEQWEGLKKYMEDFSMIKDREVPELILWEKYLVYATLFGNADKVLEQLKVVYPEFSNEDYMMNTTYFYLIAHTGFNNSFVNSVNTTMQRAYQSSIAASSSSSGGGFGGGFSGGGGGRRWWRPEVAVARKTKVVLFSKMPSLLYRKKLTFQ